MESKKDEKRKHSREVIVTTLEYNVLSQDDSVNGFTINFSESGLCFYLFHPINEGEEVKIVDCSPLNCSQNATVKWVRKVTNEIYKAGLMFQQ